MNETSDSLVPLIEPHIRTAGGYYMQGATIESAAMAIGDAVRFETVVTFPIGISDAEAELAIAALVADSTIKKILLQRSINYSGN